MTDQELYEIEITIKSLIDELKFFQRLYTIQIGHEYVPPVRINVRDLIKDSVQWSESGKYYKPLKGETDVGSKTY